MSKQKIVWYVHVSVRGQEQDVPCDLQESACMRLAEELGAPVCREHIFREEGGAEQPR